MFQIEELHLQPLLQATQEVGVYLRERYKKRDFRIHEKEDGSPVTDADLWCNDFWRERLSSITPKAEFIGEENKSHDYSPASDWVWFVDPIDGTKNFIEKTGQYYVLAGLAFQGVPVFGLYYEPETKLLITGSQKGVYSWAEQENSFQSEKITIQFSDLPKHLSMKRVPQALRERIALKTGLARTPYITNMHQSVSPIHNRSAGLVMIRTTKFWDICAPAAIMKSLQFDVEFRNRNWEPIPLGFSQTYCDVYTCLPPDHSSKISQIIETELSSAG